MMLKISHWCRHFHCAGTLLRYARNCNEQKRRGGVIIKAVAHAIMRYEASKTCASIIKRHDYLNSDFKEGTMAYSHLLLGAGVSPAQPSIRRIGLADLREVLAKGIDDFYAMPTHAVFLCIIYP